MVRHCDIEERPGEVGCLPPLVYKLPPLNKQTRTIMNTVESVMIKINRSVNLHEICLEFLVGH